MVRLGSETLDKGCLRVENRRWKAFLRMTGETTVETEKDILTQFKVMADYMKFIGVNYSMVVHVEPGWTTESNTFAWSSPPGGAARQPPGDR